MSGAIKKATGLTGLAVVRNPHKILNDIYDKILRTVARMPQDAVYRTSTQAVISERLALVKAEPDIEKLESKIGDGQIEQVIHQAKDELVLARKMLLWEPWAGPAPEAPPNQWKWPI